MTVKCLAILAGIALLGQISQAQASSILPDAVFQLGATVNNQSTGPAPPSGNATYGGATATWNASLQPAPNFVVNSTVDSNSRASVGGIIYWYFEVASDTSNVPVQMVINASGGLSSTDAIAYVALYGPDYSGRLANACLGPNCLGIGQVTSFSITTPLTLSANTQTRKT